jgi:hypothetical protein
VVRYQHVTVGGILSALSDPFPDAEALVARFLSARPELTGIPVGVTLPANFDGTSRAVLISRVGGEFVEYQILDLPVLRVETYGPDKPAAHQLARTVRGLLSLLPESRHADRAIVSDVNEERGPHWLPDGKRQGAARYMSRIQLVVHLAPA